MAAARRGARYLLGARADSRNEGDVFPEAAIAAETCALASAGDHAHAAAMSPRRLRPSFAFLFSLASGCAHDAPAPSTPSGANMQSPSAAGEASDPSAPAQAGDPPSTSAPPQMPPDVAAVNCSNDSDCELADDDCGSCRCLSLTHGTQPPACASARVQCFVAPCRGKRAVCENHSCLALDDGGGGI